MTDASDYISEAAFQASVMELARACGWRVAHFHDSRRQVGNKWVGDSDAAGFPDLVMVRGLGLLFVELKAAKGRTSAEQVEWGEALYRVAEYHVWWPRDWPEIERRLR